MTFAVTVWAGAALLLVESTSPTAITAGVIILSVAVLVIRIVSAHAFAPRERPPASTQPEDPEPASPPEPGTGRSPFVGHVLAGDRRAWAGGDRGSCKG